MKNQNPGQLQSGSDWQCTIPNGKVLTARHLRECSADRHLKEASKKKTPRSRKSKIADVDGEYSLQTLEG